MSASGEVDDLDALLDDAMATMDAEEQRHQDEVRARDSAREAEIKNATAAMSDSDMTQMMQMLQSLMGGNNGTDNNDPEALLGNLKKEIENMVGMLDSMPITNDEDRKKINEVRELIGKLDEIPVESLETTGGDAPFNNAAGGGTEEALPDAIRNCMELLQQMGAQSEGDGNTDTSGTADGAANIPMDNIVDTVLNVILDPMFVAPLRHMRDSYPRYFEANANTIEANDMVRYKKQHENTIAICDLLDEGPVDRKDAVKIERLMALVYEFSELAPPPENISQFHPVGHTQSS